MIRSESAAGDSGVSCATGTGGRVSCAAATSCGEPVNGGVPVKSS